MHTPVVRQVSLDAVRSRDHQRVGRRQQAEGRAGRKQARVDGICAHILHQVAACHAVLEHVAADRGGHGPSSRSRTGSSLRPAGRRRSMPAWPCGSGRRAPPSSRSSAGPTARPGTGHSSRSRGPARTPAPDRRIGPDARRGPTATCRIRRAGNSSTRRAPRRRRPCSECADSRRDAGQGRGSKGPARPWPRA